MRPDAEHHIQVAGRPSADPGLALAADPDLRAGVDARRYAHREPSRDSGAALPPALSARALEQPARPPAGGARGLRHDRAEDRLLRAPDLARAAAARAGLRAGPRLGPTTGAPIACRHPRHVDLLFNDGACFLDGDGHDVVVVYALGCTVA